MLNKLITWMAKKAMIQQGVFGLIGLNDPTWLQRDYQSLSREGLEVAAVAYACVSEIANAVSGVPWLLFQRGRGRQSRKLQEMSEHPLLTLLERPNDRQGQAAFMHELAAFYTASGNAFLLQVGPRPNGSGLPRELHSLLPDIQSIKPIWNAEKTVIVRFEVTGEGSKQTYDTPRQLYHMRGFHPRKLWHGLPPLAIAARSLDTITSAMRWNVALLQNMARPPGALHTTEFLNSEQRDILREEIEQKYVGQANAGRPMLLHGGLNWIQMAITPKEMDWLKGKEDAALDICRVFNVPPEMVGFAEAKTYSNFMEARKALYTETAIPLLGRIRDELNNWLVPMFGERLFVDFDRDSIEALQEERGELWARLTNAWWLTINQKLEAAGFETIGPQGDVLLVPASLLPLATLQDSDETEDSDEDDDFKLIRLPMSVNGVKG